MRPKVGEAVEAGVLRTIGTVGGALIAAAVLALADRSEVVISAAFMVGAFATVALKKVNCAVFVLFLTAVIVLTEALLGEDAEAAGVERLVATVLGALIAFLGIGLGRAILQCRQRVGAPVSGVRSWRPLLRA